MATTAHDQAAVQTRLWDEIEKHSIGMLGLVSAEPRHFQPMTAFLERDSNQIWFFTYRDTELAEAAAAGAQAMFVHQRDKELYACIGGRLQQAHDPERINRYWNPVVSAWYPEGKDDPRLTMLRFDCADGEVWVQDAGLTKFAWEIAKANATRTQPDVGERTNLNFH